MMDEMRKLLDILACPACHGDLALLENEEKPAFYCAKCDLVYPIENGIPIMLVSQAMPLAKWEGKGE